MKAVVRALTLTYIGLTALFLGYLGTTWAFLPGDHMTKLGVTATGIPAINTLKSIMGTGLLGMTAACSLFLFDRRKWAPTVILLAAVMLVVRVVSLAADGFHPRMGTYAVLELLIIIAAVTAVRLEDHKPQR